MKNLWAFPMHGELRVRREGLRTRDGHLTEWLAKLGHHVTISSRPEPWPRLTAARTGARTKLPDSWTLISPEVVAIPPLKDSRAWWSTSAARTVLWNDAPDGCLVWNPFAGVEIVRRAPDGDKVKFVLDLLDDWTIHHQFQGIAQQVDAAYRTVFERADVVFANSEGTAELAKRYGRDDVEIILNGVDPERFVLEHQIAKRVTIGYAGKISQRVDVELMVEVSSAMPEVRFVVAGPIYLREYAQALKQVPNIEVVGDVHYNDYPALLGSWDIGWVPHRVGNGGEIGGDVIKVYEYRAAGLPTFITPFAGKGRNIPGVRVAAREDMLTALREFVAESVRPISREKITIPLEMTWRHKAERLSSVF